MKALLKFSTLILFLGVLIHLSCKKEYSCENCRAKNQPPIAHAGNDTTIVLPVDSVIFDGSASTDDKKIASYQWKKISGPGTVTIRNATAVTTVVNNLAPGVYQFELKVTDDEGLFSLDTLLITVNPSASTVFDCHVTRTSFTKLPTAGGVVHTAAAGNKILFVRYTDQGVVDIYDTTTRSWSTVSGMYATYGNNYLNAVTLGNKIIYSEPVYLNATRFNEQLINIYDAETNSWSVSHLPEGREAYTSAVIGNKVIYAGGYGYINDTPSVSKKLDIYDASSNSWSSINFPQARQGMKAAAIGNKVIFAGGFITRYDSLVLVCDDYGLHCNNVPAVVATDRIDILDLSSNTWSVAYLSKPRGGIAAARVGNKIVFASGYSNNINNTSSNKADIYDASSNSWSSTDIGLNQSIAEAGTYANSVGDKVLVYGSSDKVYIYDAANNSWSVAQMPQPLESSAQERDKAAVIGNKIIFYTIFCSDSDSKSIDIYDASANAWCHSLLPDNHVRAGVISYGNRIYIAGGIEGSTNIDTVFFLNF